MVRNIIYYIKAENFHCVWNNNVELLEYLGGTFSGAAAQLRTVRSSKYFTVEKCFHPILFI